MSVETIAWAARQRTGSPLAKLVLIQLADRVDSNLVAEVYPHLLASECDMSLDELREGFRQLLHYGFIERADKTREQQTITAFRLKGNE